MLKECSQCKKYLSIDNFRKDISFTDELYCKCNICASLEEPVSQKIWNRRIYESQKSMYIKERDSKRHKEQRIKTNYNLSMEEYLKMLDNQENKCAICNKIETSVTKKGDVKCLSIDHHHESGRVRGLLCQKCNTGIGLFMEDSQILESAIEYLKNN